MRYTISLLFYFVLNKAPLSLSQYDLAPQKRGRFLKGELDPHILSQKRIEKAQKYKTLVANKEYIEDDRGNLKVLEVPGGGEPTEEELLAQVERVCPELDLEHLSSVDITAAVAAVAATGREEAEVRDDLFVLGICGVICSDSASALDLRHLLSVDVTVAVAAVCIQTGDMWIYF
jgi:hypothetical protein